MEPVPGYWFFPDSGGNDLQLEPAVYHRLRPQKSDTTITRDGGVLRSVYVWCDSEQIHGMGTQEIRTLRGQRQQVQVTCDQSNISQTLRVYNLCFVHICDGKSKCYLNFTVVTDSPQNPWKNRKDDSQRDNFGKISSRLLDMMRKLVNFDLPVSECFGFKKCCWYEFHSLK